MTTSETEIKGRVKDLKRWFKNHFSMSEYKSIASSDFTIVGFGPKGYNLNERNGFRRFKGLSKEQVIEMIA